MRSWGRRLRTLCEEASLGSVWDWIKDEARETKVKEELSVKEKKLKEHDSELWMNWLEAQNRVKQLEKQVKLFHCAASRRHLNRSMTQLTLGFDIAEIARVKRSPGECLQLALTN